MRSSRPGRIAVRRFSRRMTHRNVARRVSDISCMEALRELAVSAAVIDKRRAILDFGVRDLADEDRVIPARELRVDAAFERTDRAFDQRNAELAASNRDAGEFVISLRSEAAGDFLLRLAENAHAE